MRFDNKGRGIGNVRWIAGEDSVVHGTRMRYVFLLKRNADEQPGVREISSQEAFDYLREHDFCNPHQLLRDEGRMARREEFFRRYLSECETFMVNATMPAEATQDVIRQILRSRCSI